MDNTLIIVSIVLVVAFAGIIVVVSNPGDDRVGQASTLISDDTESIILLDSDNPDPIIIDAIKDNVYAAVKTVDKGTIIVDSKGTMKYDGLEDNRKIDIKIINRNDVPTRYYNVVILGYRHDDPPGADPFILRQYEILQADTISINAPDEEVDLYFQILAWNSPGGELTQHHFYYTINNPDSSAIIDLNDLKKLENNFYEYAKSHDYNYIKSLNIGVTFENERSLSITWTPVDIPLYAHAFYGPESMEYLRPNIAYLRQNANNVDYLLLAGNFYQGGAYKDIYIVPEDILSFDSDVDRHSFQTGSNYKMKNVLGLIDLNFFSGTAFSHDALYPTHVEYLNSYDHLYYHNYFRYFDGHYYRTALDQPTFDLHDVSLTFMKSPLVPYVSKNGNKLLSWMDHGEPETDLIRFFPNDFKLIVKLPNGQIKGGRGDLYINCDYLDYSNPHLDSCPVGIYYVQIDASSIVRIGKPINVQRFYYDGENWLDPPLRSTK
jgi:hypothetical protein